MNICEIIIDERWVIRGSGASEQVASPLCTEEQAKELIEKMNRLGAERWCPRMVESRKVPLEEPRHFRVIVNSSQLSTDQKLSLLHKGFPELEKNERAIDQKVDIHHHVQNTGSNSQEGNSFSSSPLNASDWSLRSTDHSRQIVSPLIGKEYAITLSSKINQINQMYGAFVVESRSRTGYRIVINDFNTKLNGELRHLQSLLDHTLLS
ncbi:MAG: hypothetical protein ACH350_00935 [Parachlamydiaceae bacterium]